MGAGDDRPLLKVRVEAPWRPSPGRLRRPGRASTFSELVALFPLRAVPAGGDSFPDRGGDDALLDVGMSQTIPLI